MSATMLDDAAAYDGAGHDADAEAEADGVPFRGIAIACLLGSALWGVLGWTVSTLI